MHAALLEEAVAVTGAALLVPSLTVGAVLQRARRANRLLPGHRTPAPLTWRWSPRRTAVLHRRLRRACALLVADGGAGEGIATRAPRRRFSPLRPLGRRRRGRDTAGVLEAAIRELVDRALAADGRLVELDRRRGPWRRLHLPAVAAEVDAIERAAVRIGQLRGQLDQAHRPAGPRAEQLLDAYEAALGELRPYASPVDQPG